MPDYLDQLYQRYRMEDDFVGTSRDEYFAPRKPYLNYLVRNFFPEFRDAKILDLGCGSGGLIHAARKAGYTSVVGVDRSELQVERARRFGIDGIQHADLLQTVVGLQDNSLDMVIALDVLEHLPKETIFSLSNEIFRVLRERGSWIIHTPNAQSPFFGAIRYGDFTHEIAFTARSIAQLTAMSGFSKVNVHEDVPVPHSMLSAARWFLWKLARLPLQAYLAIETGVLGNQIILSQNLLAVAVK